MKLFIRKSALLLTIAAIVSGCTTTPEKAVEPDKALEQPVSVNNYPTRDRVEYVLNCVAQHGGLTYINQYACGCKIDKIAEKLTFEEFDAAKTFGYLRTTAGETGSIFRDPAQAKDLKKRLKEAEDYADKSCFVK